LATLPIRTLPVTFERRWEVNPVHDSYYPEANTKRGCLQEGLFVGYRGYEHSGTKPLFPFGFGLSYTSFKYANLSIKPVSKGMDGYWWQGAHKEPRVEIVSVLTSTNLIQANWVRSMQS